MEIRELSLAAFGPFSGRVLKFGPAPRGLHVVYGPNEAGKSSALRGLKALLYGVDERTGDDFIHARDKLRIAGSVSAANGNELSFARRKGRKNTLVSAGGEPLGDNALAPFLRGVSPELFEMLFGIDHQALVQGGQEILEQKGEVGQALFSASLGSHTLHSVLGRLDEQSDGLFRPRGSTQTINLALKTYSDLKKEIKDRSLSAREWDEHRRVLARISHELDQIQSELAGSRIELNRQQRIRRVLPKLAGRRELRRQIADLGQVVILPGDFGERRAKAITERETARVILQKATVRLNDLETQIAGLPVRCEVLAQSEIIENLHERLGSHRKAMQDRPHLEAEYNQIKKDVELLLKELRPDLAPADIEVLRSAFAKRQRIAEFGKQYSVLVTQLAGSEKNLRETDSRLKETRIELDQTPVAASPESLRRAVVAARKSGDLDQAIQAARSEFETVLAQCESGLARLTLWIGSPEAILRLPVPNRESISRFDELYAEIQKGVQRFREKANENTKALRDTIQRLNEIQLAGAVPTEEELTRIRAERDQAWQLLRRRWVDGEDVDADARAFDAARALPEAFEYRMTGADDLADRLRRETDRVHARARLMAEQETEKIRAADIEQQGVRYAAEKKQIDDEWAALWAPCEIQPRSPREMRDWLGNLESLRGQAERMTTLDQQVRRLENERGIQIQRIKQPLQSLGKDFSETDALEAVLAQGEEAVAEFDKIGLRREGLNKEINSLERNRESAAAAHQSAENKLAGWKDQWRQSVADFGLDGDALPAQADDFIEQLRRMFAKLEAAESLRIRIQLIDHDAEIFLNEVGRVIAENVPELAGQTVTDAVTRLNAVLSENRNRQSTLEQIEIHATQARQEIRDSNVLTQAMDERLDSLCAEARCTGHAELQKAERRSNEYLRVNKEIEALEQEILNTGEGATLAELESESEAIDADLLPARIEALTNRIEEDLEPRRIELAEAKGGETKELERMDGSDEAAVRAEQVQSTLASIRSNAQQYVRLKLAAKILRDQIERYRKENQGPLLQRASDHFAVLTRGSFEGLRTDFNDKDEPVLVGIRPDQEQVHVEGMSSGTRDQLYLALRLASLEKYMDASEPMPFIVDDILVDFDDARSEAALNALLALAQKTQVILFTHHSRVVEQARKLENSEPVRIHEL